MIAVEVEDEAWSRDLPDVATLVVEAAEAALTAFERQGPAADLVTILLTDDATLRDLNARFRGKDKSTNVLSFPAAPSAAPHLGDLALAHGVCATEASEQGKRLADHLRHLVVHGVLHLLGHDHEDEIEAEAMEAAERSILGRLGVADPYRAPADV